MELTETHSASSRKTAMLMQFGTAKIAFKNLDWKAVRILYFIRVQI